MKNNTPPVNLAIKLNTQVGLLCVLCSNPTNSNIGVELMITDSNDAVCRVCGIEYAPALVALLNVADSARLFQETERDFGLLNQEHPAGLSWQKHGFAGSLNQSSNVLHFQPGKLYGGAR